MPKKQEKSKAHSKKQWQGPREFWTCMAIRQDGTAVSKRVVICTDSLHRQCVVMGYCTNPNILLPYANRPQARIRLKRCQKYAIMFKRMET